MDAPAATVDAPPIALGQKLSGKSMDYFTNLPVATAMISTDGVTPQLTATSGADGVYAVEHVPEGSTLYLSAIRTNYKATRQIPSKVAALPVLQDIYMMTGADIKRQYTSVGLPGTAADGKSILFVDLKMLDGTPLVGLPLANVKLLDGLAAPVTTGGTFFIGSAGDVDKVLTTSTAYVFPAGTPSRARVAILGIPPVPAGGAPYTLSVTYTPAVGADVTMTVMLSPAADVALLARTGGAAPTTGPLNPTFATDIYPKLQKAAAGGLGCANCHTAGGAGAVLQYDLPAATVLANLKLAPGVLNLTTPAASLLLVRPLYEPTPPQDHPNATFIDTSDPDYKLFLLWITQGAKP